jgi:hypothetical protein
MLGASIRRPCLALMRARCGSGFPTSNAVHVHVHVQGLVLRRCCRALPHRGAGDGLLRRSSAGIRSAAERRRCGAAIRHPADRAIDRHGGLQRRQRVPDHRCGRARLRRPRGLPRLVHRRDGRSDAGRGAACDAANRRREIERAGAHSTCAVKPVPGVTCARTPERPGVGRCVPDTGGRLLWGNVPQPARQPGAAPCVPV